MAAVASASSKSKFHELLGDTLQTQDGTISVEKAVEGKKVVALYFSAHWCPPCKAFTPKLVEWYKKYAVEKEMELVFVSSDKGEREFGGYFSEMPWKALPFSDRERKEALSQKFKVKGIPSLIFLDGEGNTLTTDGRMIFQLDPKMESVASWSNPKKMVLESVGSFVNADDSKVDAADYLGKSEYIGLLYSASWCGPCQTLKPELKKWLESSGKEASLSMLLITADRSEGEHDAYRKQYPFPALSWKDKEAGQIAGSLLEVKHLPTLAIIRRDNGAVVTMDAATKVRSNPAGFPWGPEACEPVGEAWGRLMDFRYTVFLLADQCTDAAEAAKAGEMLAEATKPVFDPFGAKTVQSCVGSSEDPHPDKVRGLAGLSKDKEGATSLRIVAIAPLEDKCYVMENKGGTVQFEQEAVTAFLKSLAGGEPNVKATELSA